MPKGVPNKHYTPEFKQMVVETMMRDKLSYCEAARQFEVSNHHRVADWERIYLMEGPEGLYIERRGRGSKGRPTKFPKEVEEDLLKEDFNELYRQMNGMELKEMDKIIYPVCKLCRDHERAGFVRGVQIGIRLAKELEQNC